MAMIVPTVETIGDEALTNSIIDRSITELQDNLLTNIGKNGLRNATALKRVVLGSAATINENALYGCTSLVTADFHYASSIKGYALRDCTNLETLILRRDTMCSLASKDVLYGTKIYKGTGYIYVPRELVDTYKADTKWSNFADQIRAIEEYPEACDPYSWETVAKTLENGTYKSLYKIGDTIPTEVSGVGTVNMELVAFDKDTLSNGEGTAAMSWASVEVLLNIKANPALVTNSDGTYKLGTGGVGGYASSMLRSGVQSNVKPRLPANAQSLIVEVTKNIDYYDESGSFNTKYPVQDDVWALEFGEYAVDNSSAWHKKRAVGTSNPTTWWTRDPMSAVYWNKVESGGSTTAYTPTDTYPVCISFCTGVTPDPWLDVAASIEDGTYKTKYAIGDTVPLNLGSEGVLNMQIAAFDTDPLADGSGTAAISWVSKELVKNKQYWVNSAPTSWGNSVLRSYLINTIKPMLPSSIRGIIQPVTKDQFAVDSGALVADTSTEEIWIPSREEIYGGIYKELFPDNASRVKCRAGETTKQNWWTRTLYSANNAYYVYTSGAFQNRTASTQFNYPIGFCTGKSK